MPSWSSAGAGSASGGSGRFDVAAALLALAAALALFRFKRGVIETLGASAAIGLALHLIDQRS